MKDEFIVKGAMATCQFGVAPAMINVMDNSKVYFNGKLVATSMSIGPTFQSPAFGTCNMVPNMPKPCAAVITKWDNTFTKIKINQISNPLTKDSKGTCALGCPMCISFTTTGQLPIPSVPLPEVVKVEHQSDMNPLAGNDEKMSNNSNKEKTNKQLIKESNQTENKSKQEVSTFINLSDEENILVNELVESGVKVTPEKVLAIGRNGSGKIVWLEEGSAASGYKHIELRHKKEFDKAGIKNIINFVKESAINGKETKEIQGKDRPIYEVTYQGVFYRVALQIASNGYIVSMNMVSNKK